MHIECFEGKDGWHWRFRSKGRITADSEAFPTRAHATRAARAVVTGVINRLKTKTFRPDAPRFESAQVGDTLIIKWY